MSYLVINDTLGAATTLRKRDDALWQQVPKLGVVLIDEATATEFPSRLAARRAIERTHLFMDRHFRGARHRRHDEYLIVRLQPEALAK